MKCHHCNKKVKGSAKIEAFKTEEPTTIYLFCSETCKEKWTTAHKQKK